MKRLEWSPEVDPEHIGVAVCDGTVTLSGEAASAVEKKAAIRTTAEVQGVVAVIDEIVVRDVAGTIADDELARATHAMLHDHPQLAGQPIEVSVEEQVVTLRGMVDSADLRRAARRATQAVLGVRAVIDMLNLPPAPTAALTKQRLVEALGPANASEVDHLEIRLDGHVATLEGNVHSWYERRIAERAARSMPGVTDVENKLVVTF